MRILLTLLLVVIGCALARRDEENRNLAFTTLAPKKSYVEPLPAGIFMENGKCMYKVMPGDALIKIANKFSTFLLFSQTETQTDKDCLQCPGYAQQCAIPTWLSSKSGHYGDWVMLWKANGGCAGGNMDGSRIKIGAKLVIPNCPFKTPSPTSKPTKMPIYKPTKLRGWPSPAPSAAPVTDDLIDHVIKKVKHWIGTAAPTKRPTKAPVKKLSAPRKTDDASVYYAAE